jgi:hypothetical protein
MSRRIRFYLKYLSSLLRKRSQGRSLCSTIIFVHEHVCLNQAWVFSMYLYLSVILDP